MLIPLSNSDKVAIVDDGWEEDLSGHKWWLNSNGYPVTQMQVGPWKYKKFYLHELIMGEKTGFEVDHINGDKLDNRTANLRHVTHAENCINQSTRSDNVSGHKGVYGPSQLRKSAKKWQAYIGYGKSREHLGWFETFEEACTVRKQAERQLHGEYARKAG